LDAPLKTTYNTIFILYNFYIGGATVDFFSFGHFSKSSSFFGFHHKEFLKTSKDAALQVQEEKNIEKKNQLKKSIFFLKS